MAAGGDGTVHEVVNGIMEAERPVKLGVIPSVLAMILLMLTASRGMWTRRWRRFLLTRWCGWIWRG
ncbi:MAG: acylglycerol kinase family protein [Chloroflexi bacterium]|nr:acylglycerol kinase family protein [Chloroflexota bacterium]